MPASFPHLCHSSAAGIGANGRFDQPGRNREITGLDCSLTFFISHLSFASSRSAPPIGKWKQRSRLDARLTRRNAHKHIACCRSGQCKGRAGHTCGKTTPDTSRLQCFTHMFPFTPVRCYWFIEKPCKHTVPVCVDFYIISCISNGKSAWWVQQQVLLEGPNRISSSRTSVCLRYHYHILSDLRLRGGQCLLFSHFQGTSTYAYGLWEGRHQAEMLYSCCLCGIFIMKVFLVFFLECLILDVYRTGQKPLTI